jgi:hypothetical protein
MMAQAYAFGAANLDVTGKPLTFSRALAGPDALHWEQAQLEEWQRLGPEGSQCVHYARTSALPSGRKSSYLLPVVKEKRTALGARTFRVRNTFAGNLSDYSGETKADTGDIESFKILLNSTISDPQAKMACVDISDFYLNEPLEEPEYMKVPLKDIPAAIAATHGLAALADERGLVLLVVTKTIYGLKQSGRICREGLVAQLAKHGYRAEATTPTIFHHDTRPTFFELVVDDFAVKYNAANEGDLEHFLDALREKYRIKVDMAAAKFIGITLAWQYDGARSVTLSMPGYVDKALERFHVVRGPKVMSPMRYTPPHYSKGTPQEPTDPQAHATPGTAADQLLLQQIVGTFLYLARCVDGITTIAVNTLSSAQSDPNSAVMKDADLLLQYFAWNPNPSVTFTPSQMHLFMHSDASFAGESGARSRVGAVYMLGDAPSRSAPLPQLRHPFLVASVVLKVTAANISEAEYGGLFTATQRSVPLRNTLAALGHPQAATTAVTDNSVAMGISTGTIKQKRSRSINIAYHWIRDQVTLGHFRVLWDKGSRNLADYQTKAVPAKDFLAIKSTYQNART